MLWPYILVLLGTILVDITPLPLPPAFTVMIFLQAVFGLPIWPVLIIGVIGSAIGRWILSLYIARFGDAVLNKKKINDIYFLGEKLKTTGIKGQLFILLYTMLPVSSTPLFVAGGLAKLKPQYLMPFFIAGKFTSDGIAVLLGKYTLENTEDLLKGIFSWQSLLAILFLLLFLFFLLFTDWRTLIVHRKFQLSFNIWKKRKKE